MKLWLLVAVAVILASLVAGLICLPRLPDSMAVHWGFNDQPDGFAPKAAGVVLLPVVSLLVLLALALGSGLAHPVKDPAYRRAVNLAGPGIIVPLMLLLAYAQGIVLVWNLGNHLPVGRYVLAALAGVILVIVLASAPLMRLELAASRQAGKTLPPGIWFPAKRYGWGWGFPCTWQGWVVIAVWLAAMIGGLMGIFRVGSEGWIVVLYVGFVVLTCGALLGLCTWKGEKPRWRWGDGG